MADRTPRKRNAPLKLRLARILMRQAPKQAPPLRPPGPLPPLLRAEGPIQRPPKLAASPTGRKIGRPLPPGIAKKLLGLRSAAPLVRRNQAAPPANPPTASPQREKTLIDLRRIAVAPARPATPAQPPPGPTKPFPAKGPSGATAGLPNQPRKRKPLPGPRYT